MRIDFLTLFPDMMRSVYSESIIGRAVKAGIIEIYSRSIRDYTLDKHGRTDDTPYGGGPGMIMSAQPIYDCYASLCRETGKRPHLIFMTPTGKTLTQQRAKELSSLPNIAILCGHYEGVDERVTDEIVDEYISIGDFVLTGGEIPALALADAVCRMVPGVLTGDGSKTRESFYSGLLEYPQYTKPSVWNGKKVPDVLLSGHHENIEKWRREQSLKRTKELRPDLYEAYVSNDNIDV